MSSEPIIEEPPSSEPSEEELPSQEEEDEEEEENVSALRDNIRQKGRNAYYFAHEKTPTGPKWDGKQEPKRLEDREHLILEQKQSSFDFTKSTITKYAFSDSDKSVKLYIDIDETVTEEIVSLQFTEDSLSLVIEGSEELKTLYFTKLAGKITKATFKVKADDKLMVLILKKLVPGETWHTINAKGSPDFEL